MNNDYTLGNWRTWKKEVKLYGRYYVDEIVDNFEGLFIKLSGDVKNPKSNIMLRFKDNVYAYRSIEESWNLRLIDKLETQYGQAFYENEMFFVVEDSEYVKSIQQDSKGIIEKGQVFQFTILACDYFIDIITDYEPDIIYGKEEA